MPVLSQIPPALQPGRGRLTTLDTLRGLTLVSMIGYHLCYNLDAIFDISLPWYHTLIGTFWQMLSSVPFLLIAGICTHLSGRALRHAGRTGLAAAGISLATLLFMPSALIVFGILHCLTVCQLLYAALRKSLRKVRPWMGLAVCLLLYGITFRLPEGYLWFPPYKLALPAALYQWKWLSVLGFLSPEFYSADYFPLLPNVFLFFAGHYLGYWLPRLRRRTITRLTRPLTFLGRHSMAVYLLHQPVLFGVMQLVFGQGI